MTLFLLAFMIVILQLDDAGIDEDEKNFDALV